MRVSAAMLLCCAGLLAASPVAAAAPVTGTAAAFNDSLGVGVHNYYPDTAYHDRERVKSLLVELGIKHLRGSVAGGRSADEYRSIREIAALGMKWTFITGRPDLDQDPNNFAGSRLLLGDANALAGTAEALEGPNEYDDRAADHPYWGKAHPAWKENLYQYMKQTYAGFKADPAFSNLPHYGPSFAHAHRLEEYAALPGAGLSMDRPNAHIYPGGREPEEPMAGKVQHAADKFGDPDRKPVVSETGYHNAIHGGNWWHFGVSEDAQSIYTLRALLAAFRAGAPRTFIYQLMDLRPDPSRSIEEDSFGLVAVQGDRAASETTWTIRRKPAFESVKELAEITRDSGTGAGPVSLDYSVSVPGLERVLLSRSDGSVDLVLWNSESLYKEPTKGSCFDPRIPGEIEDPQKRCEYAWEHFSVDQGPLFPADVPVTLQLAERASVSTERPHSERSFTSLGEGRTFNLNVGPDPIFIRIKSYSQAVKADEPVAYLRLNESSGAPVDSAGRGAATGPWTAAPGYGQPGAVGGGDTAVQVTGDQRATVTLDEPVHTATGSSVELWVKPDAGAPGQAEFLSAPSDPGGTDRINMRTETIDRGLVRGATPGEAGDMKFGGFGFGQWHHLVLTMGGDLSASRVYLDGRLAAHVGVDPLSPGGNWFNMSAFTVGADATIGGFKGLIDELAVYPRVLTAGQICVHYRAGGGSC